MSNIKNYEGKFDTEEFLKKQFKFFIIYLLITLSFLTYIYSYKLNFNRKLGGYHLILKNHNKTIYYFAKNNFPEISERIVFYSPINYLKWRIKYKKQTPNLIKKVDFYFLVSILIYLFSVLILLQKKKKETVHGNARWATLTEIKKMNLYSEHGVVLGKDEKGKILRDNSDKHIIFSAPTRQGKGINTANTTAYDWLDSIVFNDIKGELWRDTSGYRKKVLGQKVFMFSPVDTDGVSCSYNPLDAIAIGTAHEFEDVQVITKTLLDVEGKGESDHWITSAINLLNAVILHVKYAIPNASLYDVANFLSPPDKKLIDVIADILGVPREDEADNIPLALRTFAAHNESNPYPEDIGWEEYYWINDDNSASFKHQGESTFDHLKFQNNKNLFKEIYNCKEKINDTNCRLHPLVSKEFNSFFNTPDKERGSILSTANSKMKIFLDVIIASHIKKSDFTVKQLMEEKCSLYLVTPPKSISRTKPIFRLIFAQIVFELTGRMKNNVPVKIKENFIKKQIKKIKGNLENFIFETKNKKFKNQLLLLIDEFPALGKLEIIEEGIPYIAGYGLKCLLITQSLKQLKKVYGQDNSILDNCSIQLYLTPNENDSAKAISDMFGSYTKKVFNETKKGIELFPSRSSSYIGRALMRPEEVRTLPYEKILILLTGQNPILGNKIFSYLDKRYKDLKFQYLAPEVSDLKIEEESLEERKKLEKDVYYLLLNLLDLKQQIDEIDKENLKNVYTFVLNLKENQEEDEIDKKILENEELNKLYDKKIEEKLKEILKDKNHSIVLKDKNQLLRKNKFEIKLN